MKDRGAGFTLVEVVIAALILSAIAAASVGFLSTSGNTLANGMAVSMLRSKANGMLEKITAELEQAGATSLDPAVPAGESGLTYRRAVNFVAGEVVWGTQRRIEIRPDEALDGVDNDSDGLVDERELVWVDNPGASDERVVSWGTGVLGLSVTETANGYDDDGNGLADEPGLTFELDGEALTVRVSVGGMDGKGRVLSYSATTAIRLRN